MGVGHLPLIHYMNVSQRELFEAYIGAVEVLYSFKTIRAKARSLFPAGGFDRPGADIGPGLKARLCLILVRHYVLSPDPDARGAFWDMVGFIRSGKVAVDKGLGYLLAMLGYHLHLADHRRDMPEYLRLIARNDRGPWRDQRSPVAGAV